MTLGDRMVSHLLWRAISSLLLAGGALMLTGRALAQYGPPSTFLGTVADEEQLITPGMLVEAYVGDTLCSLPSGGPSDAATFPYGEGAGQVTFYVIDVVSAEQREGCGRDGSPVRIKIGDRFANELGQWRAGLVRMDITYGNVEPAVQPTATPTSSEPEDTPTPSQIAPASATAPVSASAVADGSPSSSPIAVSGTTEGDGGGAVARPGGLGSSVDAASFEDQGGFPVWGILLITLGVLSVVGGTIGILAARRTSEDDS